MRVIKTLGATDDEIQRVAFSPDYTNNDIKSQEPVRRPFPALLIT